MANNLNSILQLDDDFIYDKHDQICTFVVWELYNLFSQFAYTLRKA